MPTVLRWNGFRFYFFSHEANEPPHIHIDKAGASAKFWLKPVKLALNKGFKDNTLASLEKKVTEERTQLLKAWHAYFDSNC